MKHLPFFFSLGAIAALITTASCDTMDGVFLSRGGVVSAVALSGQKIPGVGTLSQNFDGPAFNNKSSVAFASTKITAGSASAAVFLKKLTGPLTVIAKAGDPAPVPGGAVFATAGRTFDDLVLNNNDDVAFIGVYTQDGGRNVKMGLFLKADGQPLVSVVLFGDALPGTGGGTCARLALRVPCLKPLTAPG